MAYALGAERYHFLRSVISLLGRGGAILVEFYIWASVPKRHKVFQHKEVWLLTIPTLLNATTATHTKKTLIIKIEFY